MSMKLIIELESSRCEGVYSHRISSNIIEARTTSELDRNELKYLLEVVEKFEDTAKEIYKQYNNNSK